MWNSFKGCHQFLKNAKTFSTVTSSLRKDDFLALCTRMCTSQQFSIARLGRNLFYQLQTHSSISCLLQKNFSTCCVQNKNKIAGDIVSSAMDDIDLEDLKEQLLKERKETHQENVHFIQKVKEVVSQKCDEMLTNLEPEDERKFKVIKLEYNFLLSQGYQILNAEEMLSQNWLEALKLSSKAQRLKYYMFLAKRSFMKKAEKLKRIAKKDEQGIAPNEEQEKKPIYEHGRIFMRIYESTMRRWQNYRLAASMMYGMPLVIDMDYDLIMRTQELKNTASQLHDIYTTNRADEVQPFHLHFTNCPEDNTIFRQFQLQLQDDQGFLATVSEESYLDLFDKESLVYLSPNGRQVLREFDHNAVYIIGAFNDKAVNKPISYAKAKEQRIKCQRFPIDQYLDWGCGSKSLTLDQTIKVMLALKNNKSWSEAFKVIPRRKLKINDSGSSRELHVDVSGTLE